MLVKLNGNINAAVVNMVSELIAAAVLLILIVYQVTSEYRHTKANRTFLLLLCASTSILLLDSLAWSLDLWPRPYYRAITWGSAFIVFLLGAVYAPSLFVYIALSIPVNQNMERRAIQVSIAMAAAYLVVILPMLLSGQVFYLNESDQYTRGPLHWCPGVIFALQAVIIFVITLSFRKRLGFRSVLMLLSYPMFPLLGFLVIMLLSDEEITSSLGHVVFALGLLVIFINIQMQQEKKLAHQEAELAEARAATMLSQIQPHFLYNSLTAIRRLCRDNPEAREALYFFSSYLRGNMDSLSAKKPVPFQTELEHTQHYLWLESLRFEEILKVEYDIQVTDFMLPVLTLQPMVENAVRHGITTKETGGTITIRTEKSADCIRIIVSDDGSGFYPEQAIPDGRSHMGIANVRGRLETICRGRLLIESAPGKGTVATIELPKGESWM